ncbi:hypothetical protein A3715_14310 [Oleiphilus sp. HI0009]|uniref:GNAT family N-acetyltransferase n=1 Tax=unclassified Oleiphilus TaxID=2631174 RepID=UPI0007C266F8|nr:MULTISPECIES: GNAT family N-acetyltransferase [unclassified Oleiphilus]KZX75562.1 hypothetical protein A3715_14310 [Oleiphilus sp. HI0009]KZY68849.1 hypothetical protein A3739_10220 [Oleiphilus sp. HI0067]KZY69433.1 hypothetical protein A3738_04340 [Oleiphilus sp. HI0066]KZY73711.1 hypothetical protein A3739_26070 [Oleiphilus sp. HI0067]
MTELEQLGPNDYQRVVDIMGKVFDDDPIQRWIFGPSMNIGLFFGLYAKRIYLKYSDSYATPDNKAAVLFLKPGISKHVPVISSLPLVPAMISSGGFKSVLRGIRAETLVVRHTPSIPHYYILGIGAVKEARGSGYGTLLMNRCIQTAESANMPIYLENSKEENLMFYQRFGFESIGQIDLGKGSPPMWSMIRNPTNSF